MKIKSYFLFSTVSGKHLVIPTGTKAAEFNGMITRNDTGAFLWKQLETERTEDELVAAVVSNYPETGEDYARTCVREFVEQLRAADCLA
jgi:hypothetical protein